MEILTGDLSFKFTFHAVGVHDLDGLSRRMPLIVAIHRALHDCSIEPDWVILGRGMGALPHVGLLVQAVVFADEGLRGRVTGVHFLVIIFGTAYGRS